MWCDVVPGGSDLVGDHRVHTHDGGFVQVVGGRIRRREIDLIDADGSQRRRGHHMATVSAVKELLLNNFR